MNTSRNPKSLYDSMVEYSFDNSLMNSHISKKLGHYVSQNLSAKESTHKLSVFSESQSFQNFVKRRAQKCDDRDNIYVSKYEFRREVNAFESLTDAKNLIERTKASLADGELKNATDGKLNIYRNLIKKTENNQSYEERTVKSKTNLFFKRDTSKEPFTQNKSEVFPMKAPKNKSKSVKPIATTTKTLFRPMKPVVTSTKMRSTPMLDFFAKKHSQISIREYSSSYLQYSNPKKTDKHTGNNKISSLKHVQHSQRQLDQISITKSRELSSKLAKKRNLSTNFLFQNIHRAEYKPRTSPSKDKVMLLSSQSSWRERDPKRITPIDSNNHSTKGKNSYGHFKDLLATEKSKEKLQKSLIKMHKYKNIKEDYIQKLVLDSKQVPKNSKTFSNMLAPVEEATRPNNKKSQMVESMEYKGDIKSLFDHSTSNNTTGKSIENLESLVKRICGKGKNKIFY